MYKNLLHDPMNVTDDEIQSLNNRRKMEKQLILEKDLDCKQEKLWFIISSEWLSQWKSFISNKASSLSKDEVAYKSRLRVSENPKIGILPPGPISNDDLYVKINDGKEYVVELKEDLVLNKHYRGVNREVWQIFHRMYGGGPIIVREDLEIYSRDLSSDITRFKESSSTKNMHKSQHSSNNIFAPKNISPPLLSNKKKRNLFLSENIGGINDDEGIPEEHLESHNS
jgi:hypothetical protein